MIKVRFGNVVWKFGNAIPSKGHALKPQIKQTMTGGNSKQNKVKRELIVRRNRYLNQQHYGDLKDLEEGVEINWELS